MSNEPKIPPHLQEKFNEQMNALWDNYLTHCQKTNIKPASRQRFAEAVEEKILGMMAENKAESIEDWSEVYVVAAAVKSVKMPVSESAIAECSQCGQSVWVSPNLKDHYKKAKGILCTDCAPEMTGKSMPELISDDFNNT